MGLEWTGPVSVPSDKNSLYGQSATKWLVASVSQSIIDQAIYIPFLCLKVLGAKGLLEYYYKELLQKIIVRLVCTLLLWHKTLKYAGIWLFWDEAAWDNPKRGTVT